MKKIILTTMLVISFSANAVLGPLPIYLQPQQLSSNNFTGNELEAAFVSEIYTAEDIQAANNTTIYDFLNQLGAQAYSLS